MADQPARRPDLLVPASSRRPLISPGAAAILALGWLLSSPVQFAIVRPAEARAILRAVIAGLHEVVHAMVVLAVAGVLAVVCLVAIVAVALVFAAVAAAALERAGKLPKN